MLVQTVAPTQADIDEILTISDAKTFMRIIGDEDNNLIQSMILSAIDEANNKTNLNLPKATFELYTDHFSQTIALPKNPVLSVDKIELLNLENQYYAIDNFLYYDYIKNGVMYIIFTDTLSLIDHKKAMKITFTSGYDKTTLPKDILSWLRVRVSTLYEYREQFVLGTIVSSIKHIDDILNRYKIRTM